MVAGLAHLLLDVQVADRDHKVDGICAVICGIINVGFYGPDKRAGLDRQPGAADKPDCVLLARGCRSRAGFDDINTDGCKPCRNL